MNIREEMDSFLRLVAVLRRQWALLVVGCALGTGAGFLHAVSQRPVYGSTALVAIGNEPWRSLLPGELVPAAPYSEKLTFDTQPVVIRSAPVAERAARNIALPGVDAGTIARSLQVEKLEGTRVFQITAEAGDAATSKKIADGIADAYIQVTTENRANNARESVRWLETQLADYESKVQRSHQAMIDYVEREGLGRSSAPGISEARGPSLLDKLREERVQAELEVARLADRYGDKHPELAQKRRELARLSAKIESEEKALLVTQKKIINYDILAGRARADIDLYSVLARKLEQANISSSLTENAITVVQYASEPPWPMRPNRPRTVLLGSVAGLLLATGIAFMREGVDERLTSARQLGDALDLPLLGSIPDVGGDESYGRDGSLRLFSATMSVGSEAFRGLRANVKFALVGVDRRVIVVTSCRPGEGKSMVTANLGAALAGAGQSVVMVDADMRRPALHHFGSQSAVASQRRGLSSLITGEDPSYESVILRGGPGQPDLLPAGLTPPNPGDFLESPVLRSLIDRLRERYDVVLLDSPPGEMFADAQVLGGMAGGVLLVARSGMCNRRALARLAATLRQGGNKMLGVVFNGADRNEVAYGYGDRYAYYERRDGVNGVPDDAAPSQDPPQPQPRAARERA